MKKHRERKSLRRDRNTQDQMPQKAEAESMEETEKTVIQKAVKKEKEKERQKSTDRRNKRTAGNGKYGRTSGFPDAGRKKLLYRRCVYNSEIRSRSMQRNLQVRIFA